MGLPSATELQSYTDLIAARMAAALAAVRGQPTAQTAPGLFDLVDASGDPGLQIALGDEALAVDQFARPEYLATALTHLCQRPDLRDFANALNTHVRSADGGGYANLRAALAAQGAVAHPLYAELERAFRGEAIFTSGGDVTVVAPPAYAAVRPLRVYLGTDGAWTDKSSEAGSASTGDVAPFTSDNDKVLIGLDRPFTQYIPALSTVGSGDAGLEHRYWNGNAFVTLAVTDNSVGWTKNQNVKWAKPADWVPCYQDGAGNALGDQQRLFWIEITRTANSLGTPPVLTCLSLIPEPILNASGAHLGVPAALCQPPVALVRITAASTVTVEVLCEVAFARFLEPTSQLLLRALTPIAQNLTVTLAYVNQAGGNSSAAQSSWTAPAALGTKTVVLTGAEGLRTARSATSVSTTATDGVFALEVQDLRTPVL